MKKIILFAVVLIILSLTSCKKDTIPAPTPMGTLAFHLHSNIDTNEVSVDSICKDASGRRLKLSVAQFYVSGIVAIKSDGSKIAMSNVCILKTIANEEYVIGTVSAGNYNSVSFNVGMDAAINQTAPSSHEASSVLSAQSPSMWFGSTAQGYIFMNVKGFADTSAANNGQVNNPFSYQLGTSAMLKTINMSNKPFGVVANKTQFIHIICDYGKLLSGVNFKTQNIATPFGTSAEQATATQIANNITTMFHYE